MFEAVTIRRQDSMSTEKPIDIGYLFECLLFYRTVYVVADAQILKQLVLTLGLEILEELIDQKHLVVIFTEQHLAVSTTGNGKIHDLGMFTAPDYSLQSELRKHAIALTGKRGRGRRIAQRLEMSILNVRYDEAFHQGVKQVLLDSSYVQQAASAILHRSFPDFKSDNVQFHCEKSQLGFLVHSNIDFQKLNEHYHRRVPPTHSSLSAAQILSYVYNAESHLYFAARQLSELAVDPLGSEIVSYRLLHLARRSSKSEESKTAFAKLVFNDAKAIREAVNEGRLKPADLLKVIKASTPFKKWLSNKDVDSDLIAEYYKEIAKETLIDRLPGKSIRWTTFTGVGIAAEAAFPGVIGPALSVGLTALDAFLFDKFFKGWKPNQFVEENLKPLVKGHD